MSKSAISPIVMPSVATAKRSDTNPARRPPSSDARGTSAAITPPSSGRKIRTESIGSASDDEEVEAERGDAGHQEQRVVAKQTGLSDPDEPVPGANHLGRARRDAVDHVALEDP